MINEQEAEIALQFLALTMFFFSVCLAHLANHSHKLKNTFGMAQDDESGSNVYEFGSQLISGHIVT